MSKKKPYVEIVKFKRHFRIYFKNNHPAYIVGEDGDLYIFHRVTHSKTSGGKKNWQIQPNPINNSDDRPMFIVKKEQHDKKTKFSIFQLELKKGANIDYPEIKRVGDNSSDTGSHHTNCRSRYESSIDIKTQCRSEFNKKTGSTQAEYDNRSRETNVTSKNIKSNKKTKHKKIMPSNKK